MIDNKAEADCYLSNMFTALYRCKDKFTIRADGTVDIIGSGGQIVIDDRHIVNGRLKIRFGLFNASLWVRSSNMTSWAGFPAHINGDLKIDECCALSPLDGGPGLVEGKLELPVHLFTQMTDLPMGITQICIEQTESGKRQGISLIGIADYLRRRQPHDIFLIHCDFSIWTAGGIEILTLAAQARPILSDMDWHTQLKYNRAHRAYQIICSFSTSDDIFECQTRLIEAGLSEYAKI